MPDNIKHKTLIFISLILLMVVFTGAWAQKANSEARSKVVVYPYAGPSEGFRSDQFVVVLDSTTANLMAELEDIFYRSGKNSSIAADTTVLPAEIVPININPDEPKILLSKDDLNLMWSKNRRLLEILTGSITEKPNRSGYLINSRIYSEIFSGFSQGRLVVLIDDSSRQSTKDFLIGHHMTILFTMAMDAKKRGQPSWLISRLLKKAFEMSGQVNPADSYTTRLLIDKIKQELKSIETASHGGSTP